MATPVILHDSRFLDGTPTATSTAAGFSALNVRDGRTYTYWRSVSAGANFITVDCGVARPADCLAIIGHNLGTANASVFVQTSTDNVSWTDRFPRFVPSSDRALFVTFPLTFARFWRLGMVTTTAIPFLAVAMLGNRLTFPFPPDAPFVPYRESIEAESVIGKTGHILGSVIRFRPIEISARFSNFTRAWVMDRFLPFWNSHASFLRPFFWAWDITTFPDMIFYVTIDKGASFEMSMSILSFVDSIELNMRGIMEI